MDLISRALVYLEFFGRILYQLDFVDDDPRGDVVRRCNDEKAVDHSHVRLRLSRGKDDDDLIDVGCYNALTVRATGRAPRQRRPAWKYLPNRPLITSFLEL